MQIDAIGEVMNISMGSAATAVSTMLDKQVDITTPRVSVESVSALDYSRLEPALLVKITYTEGISGSNVMVFSQRDMQLILNQLMGIDDPPSDDFVFDDLSMSAACEIMNQMMGSSATALSSFLGKAINISTPTAKILSGKENFAQEIGLPDTDDVVSVFFKMKIGTIMDSEFVSIMSCQLAKEIVSQFMSEEEAEPTPAVAEPTPAPTPTPVQPSPTTAPPQAQQIPQAVPPQPAPQVAPQAAGQVPPVQQMPPPPVDPQMGYPPQYGMPPHNPYYGYPPYGYPPYPQPQMTPPTSFGQQVQNSEGKPVKIMNAQFAEFAPFTMGAGEPMMTGNMDLIMNVPLSVSVEIGSTKRKIKDIMEFNQGTVIELDKQAGAPVDVVVNGQLFARGDVVVMDDNFGVRITEIIGTKELLSSLEKQQ